MDSPDSNKLELNMLRRLLRSTEPISLPRLADSMRLGSRFANETIASLHAKGLVRTAKRDGETLWAAAPGASLAQLTGTPSATVGYSGTSSLGQRRLTPAAADDDFDDQAGGFL